MNGTDHSENKLASKGLNEGLLELMKLIFEVMKRQQTCSVHSENTLICAMEVAGICHFSIRLMSQCLIVWESGSCFLMITGLQDQHLLDEDTLEQDGSQDAELLKLTEDSVSTTMRFSRPFRSCDPQDQDITVKCGKEKTIVSHNQLLQRKCSLLNSCN